VLIATVAGPLLGETVSGRQWLGLTLGIVGVSLVVADDGAALWLVILSTGGGWGWYLINLRLSGATRVSSLLYLVPPTTMVLAFLMLDETIGVLAVGGMAVCAVAVLLIRWRDPQRTAR
jgi:drug/metabolite transporter (DMT)-like permease